MTTEDKAAISADQPAPENALWRRLIRQLHANAQRKERENFGAFLLLWVTLMVVTAAPVSFAVYLQGLTLAEADNVAAEKWDSDEETRIEARKRAAIDAALRARRAQDLAASGNLGVIICDPKLCGPMPDPKETTKADLQKDLKEARIRFLIGLSAFLVFSAAVLWSQTRIARRYWDLAMDDRSKSQAFSLAGPQTWHIAFAFAVVLIGPLWYLASRLGGSVPVSPAFVTLGISSLVALAAHWIWQIWRFPGRVAWYDPTTDPKPLAKPDAPPMPYRVTFAADLRHAVRWLPVPTLLIGLCLGYVALELLPDGGLQHLSLTGADGLPDAPLWGFVLASAVSLFFTAAVMTGLGTYSYGWDVPNHDRAENVLQGLVDQRDRAHEISGQLWKMMLDELNAELARRGLQENPKAARLLYPAAPTLSLTTAAQSTEAVRLIARPLAMLIIAALVLIALMQGVLELLHDGGSSYVPSSLIWIATAMTLSFCIIVVVPLVRLGPFVSDPPEKTEDPPPGTAVTVSKSQTQSLMTMLQRGWPAEGEADTVEIAQLGVLEDKSAPKRKEITPAMAQGSGSIRLSEILQPDGTVTERLLRRHIGADKNKFHSYLESVKARAIFQQLLGSTLQGRIISVLTLIAPAAVSTLLEAFK